MNTETAMYVNVPNGTDFVYAIVGETDAFAVQTVKVMGDANKPIVNSGMRRDLDNACVAEDGVTLTDAGLARVKAMVAQTVSDKP